MRANAVILFTAAMTLGGPAVRAAPPPPLPPTYESGLVRQSCPDASAKAATVQVPVVVEPIDPKSVGVREGKIGSLTWSWGFRITSKDARLGHVVGLALNNDLGLLAVTSEGNWIAFDLQQGTLAAITTVGIAPIMGAQGAPSSLAQIYKRTLVSFPDQQVVDDFEVSTCGLAARAAPLLTTIGRPRATLLTQAAYDYIGLVGQDGNTVKSRLVLPPVSKEAELTDPDLPSMTGYHLQALSNPAGIVPFLFAAWRPADNGPETLIQRLYVPAWSDVRAPGESNAETDLVRFPRPLAALTSFYSRQSKTSYIFAVGQSKEAGGIEVFGFLLDPSPL